VDVLYIWTAYLRENICLVCLQYCWHCAGLLVRRFGSSIRLVCDWNHTWPSDAQVLTAVSNQPTASHLMSCLLYFLYHPYITHFEFKNFDLLVALSFTATRVSLQLNASCWLIYRARNSLNQLETAWVAPGLDTIKPDWTTRI